MKLKIPYFLFLVFVLYSCKNETQNRQAENQKNLQKKKIIFDNINKGWVFNANPLNATSQASTLSWNEWRLFLDELNQKPKNTIGAFQKKSTELSKKATALNDNIPIAFNTPPIKSRIAALLSKLRMLDLYLHLDNIQIRKPLFLLLKLIPN